MALQYKDTGRTDYQDAYDDTIKTKYLAEKVENLNRAGNICAPNRTQYDGREGKLWEKEVTSFLCTRRLFFEARCFQLPVKSSFQKEADDPQRWIT